ncbi:MAG TPA: sulfite exporter TauE/SafE family protein [Bryobacteraceae bacterium]|nr:sulfite exporter TauE/SafE family protein [Bryobacteraceae bacterium]
MKALRPLAYLQMAGMALAHPMGNLSVNHYARLEPGAKGVDVTYVLDLAEIPTFELMQAWNVPRDAGKDVLEARAAEQARVWVAHLTFTEDGRVLTPKILSTELAVLDGAGNLPVFRVSTRLHVSASGGRLEYEDHNYATRAGWREIVIRPEKGAAVSRASNDDADISQALTSYPQDPTKAPPQDTRAWLEWRTTPTAVSQIRKPVIERAPTAAQTSVASGQTPAAQVFHDVRPPESPAMGSVKRNDAISRILRMENISWPLMATLIGLAFWFGALHALEPGHGKTMVAAYLVGARGTPKHAALLGGMVTFTHTFSVFLLGLATMFLSRYIMPDRISKVLGIVSGLSIIWIGAMLLWKRMRRLRALHAHDHHHDHGHGHPHVHEHHHHDHGHPHVHAHEHDHNHGHSHDHDHPHVHEHPHVHDHHDHGHLHAHSHDHPHEHAHAHGAFTHTHDGHTHSHVPEGDISIGSLIALGASGGLVPCPSALILLLSAISIGRVGLGMILLVAFSLGLAIVLTATGMLVLYAKNLLPERQRTDNLFFRYMPVVSAAAILLIGVVMTSVSLGWITAGRFIG